MGSPRTSSRSSAPCPGSSAPVFATAVDGGPNYSYLVFADREMRGAIRHGVCTVEEQVQSKAGVARKSEFVSRRAGRRRRGRHGPRA